VEFSYLKQKYQDVGQIDMYVRMYILPTETELANEIKKQREMFLDGKT